MTIGAEEQTNSDQGVGTTDLKSELRCLLADDFRKRLTESALISEEQCKRLCGLLREGQNLTDISKALGVSREQAKQYCSIKHLSVYSSAR